MITDKNRAAQNPKDLIPDKIAYLVEFLTSTVGPGYNDLADDKRVDLIIEKNLLKISGKNESLNLKELFDYLCLSQEDNIPRDKHDRALSSYLRDYNTAVDTIVDIFKTMLAPQIKPPIKPRLLLTHDVDRIHHREMYFLGGYISNPSCLKNLSRLFDSDRCILKSFADIIRAEAAHNARSVFFMMCEPYRLRRYNARYSHRYRLYPQIVKLIKESGCEIGLHGSYYSYSSGDYRPEKERLEKICGCEIISGRNHYLRFNHRRTPAALSKAGIVVDTTLGFSDRDGFRNGSSFPFRLYDRDQDKALNIIEVPMVFMDTILYEKGAVAGVVLEHLQAILERVKNNAGTVSVLFHYDILSISKIWFDIYRKFLELAENMGFDFITPSRLYNSYGHKA